VLAVVWIAEVCLGAEPLGMFQPFSSSNYFIILFLPSWYIPSCAVVLEGRLKYDQSSSVRETSLSNHNETRAA